MDIRRDGRFLASVLLLCLPTVAVGGFCLYFWLEQVPNIVRAERGRIAQEYRKVAEAVHDSPRSDDWKGVWRKGFGGYRFTATRKWSHFATNGLELVWVDASPLRGSRSTVRKLSASGERQLRGRLVKQMHPADLRRQFGIGLCAVFAMFLAMTVWSLYYLYRNRKEKDDFLAATVHDLTTPLVGMRMMIGFDDDTARTLDERMIRLVANLRDFLMLGGHRRKPSIGVFDLRAAYREAYGIFRSDYRDALGSDVPIEVPEDFPPVCADETLTVQVLWNLLGNDLKYAAPYGPVCVRFRHEGGMAFVDIADGGQGMSRHQMRRCFDRYYRVKTVKKTGKGGFGIGLCTAREFARAMGGDLTVRSNTPSGCVFTLSLPLAPQGERRAQGEDALPTGGRAQGGEGATRVQDLCYNTQKF